MQKIKSTHIFYLQAGFRKGIGTRDQIADICWIMEKARDTSPGDLPNPGTEPTSPALAGRFFTASATGEALAMGIPGYPETSTKYCI